MERQYQDEIKKPVTRKANATVLTPEQRAEKDRQTKEFIREMNAYVAEHGVLTDSPYFGVFK
ncbi:hypothetical protein [Kosakonia sp. MUSA4]|uniref:hypothetical protein n=1 Tax=Kosakonia sp. MUSA4 TaxID=2067958 RepID=UPI00159B4D07|nr:hypothetical protein [Kosakonia sp. MUSA4]QJT80760.1 hypothetical protein C0557_12100 [Kosakonia sp. MUSA4]